VNDGADETSYDGSAAAALAPSLVGLTGEEAAAAATSAGFEPDVLPPGTTAVTMEFRPRRIRLFMDDGGRVGRATAG
jgi:hypothetical protein